MTGTVGPTTPPPHPPALMHIAGTGSALPGEPVDNAALSGVFGISEDWIDIFVGTRTRHFGWDPATGKVTHTLADLCAEAAGRALAAAGATGTPLVATGEARPHDFGDVAADPAHAAQVLGWRPRTPLRRVVEQMVAADLARLRSGREQDVAYLGEEA